MANEAKRHVEAVQPLIVVDACPVETCAHVDAPADGLVGDLQAPCDTGGRASSLFVPIPYSGVEHPAGLGGQVRG
jgi:hypothetical protein